jgi:hypothetical protein
MASEIFLEQFSKTPPQPGDCRRSCQMPWLTLFVRWEGNVPLLQPLYDGLYDSPYAILCRSLHHFTLHIGNKEDKVSTHSAACKAEDQGPPAPSPLPSASGILPRLAFRRPAGYISPRHMQGNSAGNRFPLASRRSSSCRRSARTRPRAPNRLDL